MSGELIVNDTQGSAPRMGGYEFQYDPASGLWRAPYMSGWVTVDWGFGHAIRHVRSLWGNDATAETAKPSGASPLWDNPDTVTEDIIAYRAWDYDFQVGADSRIEVRLESLHTDFYWDGPVTTADEPPTAANQNGLYSIRGDEHHQHNFEEYMERKSIWGRIALSGVVVEGTHGYRAERATIQELFVNPDELHDGDSPEGLCRLLGDRYQCDVSVRAPEWGTLCAEVSQ